MVVRNLLLAVRLLIVLSSLVVVACAVVAWRIASGPVSLDFMEPYLADAFNANDHGLQVAVGETWLVWRGFDRGFDIIARNWQVSDLEGQPLASLPDVTIAFSSDALARGVLAPRSLSVEGASLTLVRDTDGRFAFSPAGGEEDIDLSSVAQPVLDRLLGPRDSDRPLTFLSEVRLSNGKINYVDRRLDAQWRAEAVDLHLVRSEGGLAGTLRSSLRLSEEGTGIAVRLGYERRSGQFSAEGDIAPVRVATLASLIPALAGRLESTLSVHGAFDLTVTLPDGAFAANLAVQGGAGQFRLVGLQPAPLSLASLGLTLSIADSGRKIVLEKAVVELSDGEEAIAGPRIELTATTDKSEEGTLLNASLQADKVAAEALPRLWPPQVAAPARQWVTEHILGGTATDGQATVSLLLPDDGQPLLRSAGGSFRFSDVIADYFPPLPAAERLEGVASFDADAMTFDVSGGVIEELAVTDGRVAISGLQLDDQAIDINFGVTGPLAAAWRILEHPRLRLISKLGLESGRVAGSVDARLRFAFPLVTDLTPDQLAIDASARLRNAVLGNAILGQDVTDGDFQLEVDSRQMRLSGPLRLAAVPLRAQWTEIFQGPSAGGRIVAEVPDVPLDRLRDLGLPVGDYADGRLHLTIAGRIPRVGADVWSIDADLTDAILSIPQVGWQKPAGAAGKASARLVVDERQLQGIEDLSISVPAAADVAALATRGRIGFGPQGQWRDATLEALQLGRTSLDLVTVSPSGGGGFAVTVAGGVLDGQWLADQATRSPSDGPAQGSRQPQPGVHLTIHQLARVLLAEGRWLEDVSLDLTMADGRVARLTADGRYPNALLSPQPTAGQAAQADSGRLSLAVKPAAEGLSLTARTKDFGALLRLLDLTGSVVGGTLDIDAVGTRPLFGGRISGGSFLLRGAPLLARVLLIASLTGLGDALEGDGISFDTLSGDFTYDGERLSSDLLRAYGASLGISARGDVNIAAKRLDLSGTLVPAYAINQVIGSIPLLGFLITGGEGGGLLGVNYSLTGPFDDPQFQVNPLSALAPGFLKWLFDLPAGDAGSTGNPVPPHMSIENRG